MAETPPPIDEPASLVDARRLDRLCDRFEAAWREGGRPSLEAFLAEAPAALRVEALRQLLLLDVEYRRLAGEAPALADYLPRFGDCAAVVHEILDASPPASPPAATASPGGPAGSPMLDIPGYEILGELGRGGMGVVYQAWQEDLRRLVAVKVLLLGTADAARFRIETEAIARLQHPNVVQIYEVGQHEGRPFVVLEYVEGGSLSRKLASASLPVRKAAALAEVLARTVHYVHQRGIIHRDLKPDNVLLADDGTAKIADFGLAKLTVGGEATHTRTGEVMGTPSYMAPEQASGATERISARTDVYALGCILYEMVTGRPPFKGPTALDTLAQVCSQEPVPLTRVLGSVPRDLNTICLKCLEKEPGKRYASALELAEDLARFLAGEPIRARPPSALRRAGHWIRRHPATVSVLAAGALLLLTVTLGAIWHSVQLGAALEREQWAHSVARRNEEHARQNAALADQLAYASDLRLAGQLLRAGDVYHLSDLLEPHRPGPRADDRREFAWYYLRQFSLPAPPPALRVQLRGGVDLTAVSADGRLLLTAGESERVARVWEMRTGHCLLTAPCTAAEQLSSHSMRAALSPDGRTLAVVAPGSWRVRLLETVTGKEKGPLPLRSPPDHLAWTADGRALATVAGGQVQFWDARSLQPRGQAVATEPALAALALSPDGRTLAVVPRKDPHLVRLHDLPGGILRQEVGFHLPVISLAYAPKGKLLAVTRHDGQTILFRTAADRLVAWRSLGPHNGGVLAFTPDGHWLAVGAAERVQIWNLRDGNFVRSLRWQASEVSALAFSPDGRTLAVGTWDGLLHRVNPHHPPLHETLRATLRPRGPPAVSHDGKTLALPDEDDTVKLVDAASGEVRLALPAGGILADCAFSPDDRTLATTGTLGTGVRLWDTLTGKQEGGFRTDSASCQCLAFSPRGGLLAAGDDAGTVWVWDLATRKVRGKLTGHGTCNAVAFSSDGQVLATCTGSAVVRLWEIPPRGPIPDAPRPDLALRNEVRALAFAPTGRTLAVGEANGEVELLGIPSAGPARSLGRPLATGTGAGVENLAFAPDGKRLLVSHQLRPGVPQTIDLWDVASGAHRQSVRRDFSPSRRSVAWMPGDRLLVQSVGGDVQIEDLKAAAVRVLPRQGLWTVTSLAFSPDGRSLYLGTDDPFGHIRTTHGPIAMDARGNGGVADTVRVWDVERLTPGPRLPGEQALALPARIALSADGRLLAAGAPDGSIWLWDLPRRRRFPRLFLSDQARKYAARVEKFFFPKIPCKPEYGRDSEGVLVLAFSPNGHWLAAAGERGTVTLWDTATWGEHHPLAAPQDDVGWVGFSPDSALAVARKGQVRLCDPGTGKIQATLGGAADPRILCGAFSPDGRLLATGTARQTVRVWNLDRAEERRTLSGHMNRVAAVAFSPDGKTLASGDWSGAVKLWSSATFREVASLAGHAGKVNCLAFSPDGQTLATGVEAGPGRGEVFLWRAPRH